MCMCVDIWWTYMVANLILLCSLKNISLIWNLKIFLRENRGYLINLFLSFSGRHLSTHCFRYLGHFCVYFFSILFFMNNFYIAEAFFLLQQNFWEITTRTWSIYLEENSIKHIFGVYSKCRSKIFLGGSRWNDMLLRLPLV